MLSAAYLAERRACLAVGALPFPPRERFSAEHEDWCRLVDAFLTYDAAHSRDTRRMRFLVRLRRLSILYRSNA